MEKKYISENRYKKVSSDNRRKRGDNLSKNLRRQNAAVDNIQVKEKKVKRSRKAKTNKKVNKFKIILLVVIIFLICCALRYILKEDNESFFNIFGVKIEDNAIEKLDIAIVESTDVLDNNSKNVILTELNNYTSGVLLKVTENYNIQYELLENIEKENNSTYVLKISKNNDLTSNVLKSRLESYTSESSKYYENCKMIENIEEIDTKTVRISLNKEVPLFIYNLQIPINFSTTNTGIYNVNTTRSASNKITYIKKENINTTVPKSISLTTVKNDEEAIEMFNNGAIDMFFTDSYDISEKLGKTEVDIRSYLNGKCLFLFGNISSEFFSKKEIRQAIAYGIDREKIRKEVYLNAGDVIDIPEIYSEMKYKYDIYAAQNILLASGYTMQNSKLIKDGEYVKLTLLVNKTDETKVKVATYVKDDLESIGIEVDVRLLTSSEIEKQVEQENYDLVLADISLNESPDISFIEKYVNVSEKINEKLEQIKNTNTVEDTVKAVTELMQALSDEVVCVGIHADSTYMISGKGLKVFSNMKYMNVFTNLLLTNEN